MANGKIAMKLEEEGETLVSVQTCSENQQVFLAARSGKCIRFPMDEIRVFKSRSSTGVRGIRLAEGDEVVSMTILDGAEFSMEERSAYLKVAPWRKGDEDAAEVPESSDDAEENTSTSISLSAERIAELAEKEQFILTLTENGYGKRSSAYEYRVTHRGGSGITSIVTSTRNGKVVASMPVEHTDQIMLMTNQGKLIRCPIADVRIAGRNTQGVTIFRTDKKEMVISAVCIPAGNDSEEAELTEESGVEE
jgi:DNA gyrase subunit A